MVSCSAASTMKFTASCTAQSDRVARFMFRCGPVDSAWGLFMDHVFTTAFCCPPGLFVHSVSHVTCVYVSGIYGG